MFNIGDKIVYPMHGAGVIESIEEKEVLGERQKYYVMRMPIGDMKVMVPTTRTKDIGIREIIKQNEVENVFNTLTKCITTSTELNWNKRYRENMEKMKSGDIFEIVDVVKSLANKDKEKGLSICERRLFNNAKDLLISEIALANQLDKGQVENMIDKSLEEGFIQVS